MSVSELNHLMTYVIDGWMLFSAGFMGIAFVSFVSRRIQEDIAAEALALTQGESQGEAPVSAAEKVTVIQTAAEAPGPTAPSLESSPTPQDEPADESDPVDADEAARLEEVAAVSEKLSKTKEKQSGSSSVSVST